MIRLDIMDLPIYTISNDMKPLFDYTKGLTEEQIKIMEKFDPFFRVKYSWKPTGGSMTNAEKSNEFARACHYRELVNQWHKEGSVPDRVSDDPAIAANNLLKLYQLVWDNGRYEIRLKELV